MFSITSIAANVDHGVVTISVHHAYSMPGIDFFPLYFPSAEGKICISIYIYVYILSSDTCLCARTFIRNVRRGGHNPAVGVTLPEVWARSVQCVAGGKPFELCWPWAWIRQIPGFPQHPASCARTKGIPFLWYDTLCARTRPRSNINIWSVFCPLVNTAMSTANTQRAQQR